MVFTRFSVRTDSDSVTDGHTRKQNASGTDGFRWQIGINVTKMVFFVSSESDDK